MDPVASTPDTSDALPLAPEWQVSPGLTPYSGAIAAMERQVDAIARGRAAERIWLVEHPPVITAGSSAAPADLVEPGRFPLHETGRGGRHTYHGPGQRVVYVMLDLARRGRDVRRFVSALEGWAIEALAGFGVRGFRHPAGTGIWVETAAGPAKIGAIGVRVRRWVSFHGLAVNIATDLSHFDAIVPCGLADLGVARLADLAPGTTMADFDEALRRTCPAFLAGLGAAPTLRAQGFERRKG